MTDSEKIIGFIQELWNDFVQTRAHFPYLTSRLIGAKSFESPGFYKRFNNKLVFMFEKPVDQTIINQNNNVAHWRNQSVLIRLAAILDGEDIIKNKSGIDQTIEGSKQIDILLFDIINILVYPIIIQLNTINFEYLTYLQRTFLQRKYHSPISLYTCPLLYEK